MGPGLFLRQAQVLERDPDQRPVAREQGLVQVSGNLNQPVVQLFYQIGLEAFGISLFESSLARLVQRDPIRANKV